MVDITSIVSGTSSLEGDAWYGGGWPSCRLVMPNVALVVFGSSLAMGSPLGSLELAVVGCCTWFGLIGTEGKGLGLGQKRRSKCSSCME